MLMATQVYTKETPATGLVTLSEAKEWLKISADAYDTEITNLIAGVLDDVEEYCWRQIGDNEWLLEMDDWETEIEIRKNKLTSVNSISYYDTDNVLQVLPTADYRVYKTVPAVIKIDDTPGLYERPDAVQISFQAGEALNPQMKTNILRLIASAFEIRQNRRFDEKEWHDEVSQMMYKYRYNFF